MSSGSSMPPPAAGKCAFCHASLGDVATVSCPDCGTGYHDDCLAASGRCALPGCAPDDSADTSPAATTLEPPYVAATLQGTPPFAGLHPSSEARPHDAMSHGGPASWTQPLSPAYGAPMPPTSSHQTGHQSGGGIPLPVRWGAGIAGVVLLLVLVSGGGSSANDELAELASETCEQIDGTTLLTASFIVEAAVEDATDLGRTDTQLFRAMWDECPITMQQIADAVEELQ